MVSEKAGQQLRYLLTLHRLVEGITTKTLPAIIDFVDFRKGFESINRGKPMEILRACGVQVEMVDVINMMYNNTTVHILSPDEDTEFVEILARLHGDTLAPYLFIIVLD